MRTNEPILVTGATGMQGGATVNALLIAGFSVRALVRDPATERAQQLARRGVHLVRGHFDDPRALVDAMTGAIGVFSMQNVSPPADPGAELRHGGNLLVAARQAGVQRFVHTSVARAGRQDRFKGWSAGRWPAGYWNGKSGVNDLVRASGLPAWTILKPAYMLDNFLPPKVAWMYPGLAHGAIETAMAPDAALDVLAAADVGRFAAAAFAAPHRFAGEEIDLAAARITMPDMAQLIARATGRPVQSHTFAPEALVAKGYVPGLVDSQVWATLEGYQVDLARAASFGVELESPADWVRRNRERFWFDPI